MIEMREASCITCRYFGNQARDIEAAFPGLSALSSAYASVLSDDGLCMVHDRYVAASSRCPAYEVRVDAVGSDRLDMHQAIVECRSPAHIG